METNTTKNTVRIIVILLILIGIVASVAGYFFHKSINVSVQDEEIAEEETSVLSDADRNKILEEVLKVSEDERIPQSQINAYLKEIKSEQEAGLPADDIDPIDTTARQKILEGAKSDTAW